MFILILLFFFTNVFLWHDSATKTMNSVLSDKLNSLIEVAWETDNKTLAVTNNGGVGTGLSRLWIITDSTSNAQHLYVDLENIGGTGQGLYVNAGTTVTIELDSTATGPYSSPIAASWVDSGRQRVRVQYDRTEVAGETFTVLTTLGNMATPKGTVQIIDAIGGSGDNTALGSVVIADFSTFQYYHVSGSTLSAPESGYSIDSDGDYVAFSVTLTNLDSDHRTISLNENSQMFFINPNNPTKVSYLLFYIVNVNGVNIEPGYSDVDLPFNVPTTIYFASENPITGSTGQSAFHPKNLAVSGHVDAGVYPLNLALLGTFNGGDPFGQNIPFVSVYVNS
jgi:hypothetical protein